MAVRIRLKRLGRKNRPCFRIEVFDARTKRDGRSIETVGTYDPLEKDEAKKVTLKEDKVRYWLSVGAKPSETVASFLKRRGISKAASKPKAEGEEKPKKVKSPKEKKGTARK